MEDLSTGELIAITGSIASALGLIWTSLQGLFLPLPLVSILLAVSLTYVFQQRGQRANRRYDKRRQTVVEVMDPLRRELSGMLQVFEVNEREYLMNTPGRSWSVDDNQMRTSGWREIRMSYRSYLVPEPLRGDLNSFYTDLEAFELIFSPQKITNLAGEVLARMLPDFKMRTWPHFFVKRPEGGETECWFWGLVFWKVDPTEQKPGELIRVSIDEEVPSETPSTSRTYMGEDAKDFAKRFLSQIWLHSDKDDDIQKARRMHHTMKDRAKRLLAIVENEITEWVNMS